MNKIKGYNIPLYTRGLRGPMPGLEFNGKLEGNCILGPFTYQYTGDCGPPNPSHEDKGKIDNVL
jgi:hypothetical protein